MARVHGLEGHPLYRTWQNMIRRCSDPESQDYPGYGARGITVCPRWACPETGLRAFIGDMFPDWSPGLQLDRKDNAGPYSPENVRWATPQENARNRRSNRIVSYAGREMPLVEACELSGADYFRVAQRIHKGLPEELWFHPGDLRKLKRAAHA